MYDTVNFWIDSHDTPTGNPFDVSGYLFDTTDHNKNGVFWQTGYFSNYIATITPYGIKLSGSLSKLLKQANIYYLTIEETKQAIEYLSDSLHVDIANAELKRVDVSTGIPTECTPHDYLLFLGSKMHFKRIETATDTLYYNTHKKVLCFYDKVKEAKKKKAIIPPTLAGCNLLKYELRFVHKLKQQFGQTETPTGRQLYEPEFYRRIVEQWRQEFISINKINQISNYNMNDNVKTPKDLDNALLAYYIQQAGGQSEINRIIAAAKGKELFKDPKYYSRAKSNLNKYLTTKGDQNDLITELETKINDIADKAIAI